MKRSDGKLAQAWSVRPAASGRELERLREPWNEMAGPVPFRRWDWLAPWWRHYRRPGDDLYVLCVRDAAARLVGLAPFYRRNSRLEGHVLRFLGDGEVHSDYVTILSVAGAERETAERLADWLLSDQGLSWDAILLGGVRPRDTCARHLIAMLQALGCRHWSAEGPTCLRLALPEDWEGYVRTLSKKRRTRVRKLIRRQFDAGRAVSRWVVAESELDRVMESLKVLHQRRRRSLGQRGLFASPAFSDFLAEATRRFLALDSLRLNWIELEGEPVAAVLDFSGGDTVYHYQSGIEPRRVAESPGWLGTISAVRQAMADGYRVYDFLRGEEPYKMHWRAKRFGSEDVCVVFPSAGARLRNAARVQSHHLRQWARIRLRRRSARGSVKGEGPTLHLIG